MGEGDYGGSLEEIAAWGPYAEHSKNLHAREQKWTQRLQSSGENTCVLRFTGPLGRRLKCDLLETSPSALLPAMPGMRCWDTAPVSVSPRMARRFLVFPEKGSLRRVGWVKTNCWLQHVRPISSNSGTTGVDAGMLSKCNQTPPVARWRVIQWGLVRCLL